MDRYKITCCFCCPDRIPGCHGTCEKYKTEKAEYEATKAAQDKAKAIRTGLDASLYASVERTAKRTNYRDRKGK